VAEDRRSEGAGKRLRGERGESWGGRGGAGAGEGEGGEEQGKKNLREEGRESKRGEFVREREGGESDCECAQRDTRELRQRE